MGYDDIDVSSLPVESPSPDSEVRSVYEGDISSSILQKLAAYYNDHAQAGDDYIIVRPSQNDYRLYYGGTITGTSCSGSTMVRYYGSTSGYSTYFNLSVTEDYSGSIDSTGYSGYIYSSIDSWLPNPYISDYKPNYLGFVSLSLLLVVVTTVSLISFIRGFFYAGK